MEVADDGTTLAAASSWSGPSRRRHLLQFILHFSKELVFMEVLEYNIGSSSIAFIYLEELLIHFRFATSYDEDEVMKIVLAILMHVLKPDEIKEKNKMGFEV